MVILEKVAQSDDGVTMDIVGTLYGEWAPVFINGNLYNVQDYGHLFNDMKDPIN